MFGFSKKKNPSAHFLATVAIQTIPVDFYAGQNPVVKFKTVEKEVDWSRGGERAKTRAAPVGGGEPLHPVHFISNRKFLFTASAVFFTVFVAGVSWYYWHQATTARRQLALPQTPASRPSSEVLPTPGEITAPSATATIEKSATEIAFVTSTPFIIAEAPLQFPSRLLGDSPDSDSDGATDIEEEVWKTDPEVPDSDSDKYSDGHEVYNLYNPAGKEPQKLVDSGLIKEFTNPVFGYQIYYPFNWAVGNVDDQYRDMLFNTITGENVEVRVFDKAPEQSFNDWFAKEAAQENFADLVPFSSVFKENGWRRNDYLVYYFEDERHVYVIAFHTIDSVVVNYRLVIKMMARSFRRANNTGLIPTRLIEGGEPGTESSLLIPVAVPSVTTSPSATTTALPRAL